MLTQTEPASSMEIGPSGAFHVKRLWSKNIIKIGDPNRNWPGEWDLDRITTYSLGLSLEETFQYLAQQRPSFEEFENWIPQKNNGKIDQRQISRLNSFVSGSNYSDEVRYWLNEIEASEPVLNGDDLEFWNENGYVVLHDAVPIENCRTAENAIWEYLRMNSRDPDSWCGYTTVRRYGIMFQFFHHPALQANRDSKRIHKAFAQLWGTADLCTTIDRVSFNPPERDGWKFPGPHLHWDTELKPPVRFGTQGILYLTDTTADQGAFKCVPGFHRQIDAWLDLLPSGEDPRKQNLESLGARPIAGHAGDLIIWQNALPHGSCPNTASRPRIAQYIKMFPLQAQASSAA